MKKILLVFSNDRDNPLDHLTQEDNLVYDILNRRAGNDDYTIIRESFATPERINLLLGEHRDDLVVFHFSGHAGFNELSLNGGKVFTEGMAKQLQYSAEKGVLKLVVLNGCSTCGSVKDLLLHKVPAVVSTNCPVGDLAAKEFSVRFWKDLAMGAGVNAAYDDGVAAASTVSGNVPAASRHLTNEKDEECDDPERALWRLDYDDKKYVEENPLPFREEYFETPQPPNIKLINTLFESFRRAGNPIAMQLAGDTNNISNPVSLNVKQTVILNNIPFPIGIHLQKLMCPTEKTEQEGYDRYNLRRLKQVGQFFQVTTEFLGIIMIAQIWEVFLRYPEDFKLNQNIKTKLKEYLLMNGNDRDHYDYFNLIGVIKEYLFNYRSTKKELVDFINCQDILKDFTGFDQQFRATANYLSGIRDLTLKGNISENNGRRTCVEAEDQLCIFAGYLGFIHRYQLHSVQAIDIMKLRHIANKDTEYKHHIIKCMQAIGIDEQCYYSMKTYLDNWGVMLIKCDIVTEQMKGRFSDFQINVKDYLNLSPFIIDRRSFQVSDNLTYIMFFKSEDKDEIRFKKVIKPLEERDGLKITARENYDSFEPIRIQLAAFKEFIA